MKDPVDLPGIRNITVSGRIGSGATTLAVKLGEALSWDVLDGGKLFRKINQDLGMSITESNSRPDHFDLKYEERVKKILRTETHSIIQSHLAGFDAQGIDGVFKILIICEDEHGEDKKEIRIDRLVNRDGVSIESAKHEVGERERQHLEKFRRLYANNNQEWVYWDKKYYDLVISTYNHNQDETLRLALARVGYKG
ncbi:MAG: hypothetical protein HY428_01390 [Candidatus Levybacteria bacterium]|nr:hypothetical protein [Candidatus Levybacteria bacterium]